MREDEAREKSGNAVYRRRDWPNGNSEPDFDAKNSSESCDDVPLEYSACLKGRLDRFPIRRKGLTATRSLSGIRGYFHLNRISQDANVFNLDFANVASF